MWLSHCASQKLKEIKKKHKSKIRDILDLLYMKKNDFLLLLPTKTVERVSLHLPKSPSRKDLIEPVWTRHTHNSLAFKSGYINSRQSILTDVAHPGGCFDPTAKMRGDMLAAIFAFLSSKSPLVIVSILEDFLLPTPFLRVQAEGSKGITSSKSRPYPCALLVLLWQHINAQSQLRYNHTMVLIHITSHIHYTESHLYLSHANLSYALK